MHDNIVVFDDLKLPDLGNARYKYNNPVNYFCRVPNHFIQQNITERYGLNRIFLVVYLLIDRHKTIENKSYLSIGHVLRICGYNTGKRKPSQFYEIVKSLLFLKKNYFIEVDFDMNEIEYDTLLEIKIIEENFIPENNFTKLYGRDFDIIMKIKTKTLKENILLCFVYALSYIGDSSFQKEDSCVSSNDTSPHAFFQSISNMSKNLSMSKNTIGRCMEHLTTHTEHHNSLLIKKEVGSVYCHMSKEPKNIPNIYVLNKKGYQQEINLALEEIKKIYGVKSFAPLIKNKRNNT